LNVESLAIRSHNLSLSMTSLRMAFLECSGLYANSLNISDLYYSSTAFWPRSA
jgi:hypothetical protein